MAQNNYKSRLPHEFRNTELLKALKETDKQHEEFDYPNDLLNFLSYFEIKPGTEPVTKRTLYGLYSKWSKDPLEPRQFNLELCKFLPSKYTKKSLFFINIDFLSITKKTLEIIQEHTKNKTKIKKWKQHFEAFLKFYNIEPGTEWTEGYVLYHLYDKWHYEKNKNIRINFQNFFKFCDLFFSRKRITRSKIVWYGIKEISKEFLSNESLTNIRTAHGIYEKEPKKYREISSIRTKTESKNKK